MFRFWGSVAGALMVIGLSAPISPATAAGVTVTLLGNFTPDIPRGVTLDKLIAEFNAKHQGAITVVNQADPDYPTLQLKIRSQIATGSAPDLFFYSDQPTDRSRENSGVLMDWKPILDADPAWKAMFPQNVLDSLTVDGHIYGIPADRPDLMLYYHSDLFQQAGISAPPKTWDEFFADAGMLKKSNVAPLALMTADDAWHAMILFSYLAVQAGGPDVYGPGVSLDSPAIVKAATTVQQLFADSTPDAVGANYAVSSGNFVSKKAATIFDGPYLNNALSLTSDPCTVKIVDAPTFDGKPAAFRITEVQNAWAAAKQTDPAKQAAVVEWMKFFTSNASAVQMAVDGQYLPNEKLDIPASDLARASCLMAAHISFKQQPVPEVAMMSRLIPAPAQAALPALLEALALGQKTPAEFATALQAANHQ